MDVIEMNLRRALIACKLGPAARRKQAEAMFPPEPPVRVYGFSSLTP